MENMFVVLIVVLMVCGLYLSVLLWDPKKEINDWENNRDKKH